MHTSIPAKVQKMIVETSKYGHEDPEQVRAERKMAAAFAANGYSLLSAESATFVGFVRELNNRFAIPGRRRLKAVQAKIACQIKEEIKDILRHSLKVSVGACALIAIYSQLLFVTDIQKKELGEAYIDVYLIAFDLRSHKKVAMFAGLAKMTPVQGHNHDHVHQKLDGVLQVILHTCAHEHAFQRYGTGGVEDCDYIVTDNGSSMIKAFSELADDIAADEEEVEKMEEGMVKHSCQYSCAEVNVNTSARLPCMCRIVVRALAIIMEPSDTVKASLPPSVLGLINLLNKCREVSACAQRLHAMAQLVHIVRTSTSLLEEFVALERAAGRRFEKTMMPAKTRWLYTYTMLQQLIDCRTTVDQMCAAHRWTAALNVTEWNEVIAVAGFLRHFYDFVSAHEVNSFGIF
ncbi:unnamed protein product [Sphagnum balticum]